MSTFVGDIVKVREVGSTIVISLTKPILRTFHVEIGDRVWLDATPDSVRISKLAKRSGRNGTRNRKTVVK